MKGPTKAEAGGCMGIEDQNLIHQAFDMAKTAGFIRVNTPEGMTPGYP